MNDLKNYTASFLNFLCVISITISMMAIGCQSSSSDIPIQEIDPSPSIQKFREISINDSCKKVITFYTGGRIESETIFCNQIKHGREIFYKEDGSLKSVNLYEHNRLIKTEDSVKNNKILKSLKRVGQEPKVNIKK